MKIPCLVLLLTLSLILHSPLRIQAEEPQAGVTYFKWHPATGKTEQHLSPSGGFDLDQGSYTITGSAALRQTGEQLLAFLADSEIRLSERFGLNPGNRSYTIPLMAVESISGRDQQLALQSGTARQMVFPLPVDTRFPLLSETNRFALFNLLHTLIRANLAFGSAERLPVSSHAFRFIDGLSGFLAMEMIRSAVPGSSAPLMKMLSIRFRREETARRFSSAQLLAQNANSEDTDILAGLNQFFSGIGLTRNSDAAINLADGSSTADRIRVFEWIQSQHGSETIRRIIAYLARDTDIWVIEETAEDSFCREYIRFGCREKSIDGTRSDIILQYATGMTFAELLRESRVLESPSADQSLQHFPLYGFDYPKAGGANENIVGLHLIHDRLTVRAGDVIEEETIAANGVSVELGIRDEANRVQVQVDYSSGRKNREETLRIDGFEQSVPQTIVSTDLLIGSRILKTGYHSGRQDEIGVYFHWKRLQVEWDTRQTVGKKTDREYLNSGFFLLDIQNTTAWIWSRIVALGINYDLQLGLVNQSGSISTVRNERYNTDTSSLILGLNLGPEFRIRVPSISMDLRVGSSANLLWQPLDDEGGKSGGNNTVNASQQRLHLYATFGVLF